jgi:hypothetical protein
MQPQDEEDLNFYVLGEKMKTNYKYFSYLLLFLLLASSLYILLQRQLHKEKLEEITYAVEIKNSASKIRKGMSREEVIKIVGYPPDKIDKVEDGTMLRWSAYFHQGKVTEILYKYDGFGSYWLTVWFDSNDTVTRISE